MTDTMPRKPKPQSRPEQPASKSRGPTVMIRPDPQTEAELVAYINAQDVAPDRSAVGLKALREFLVSRGFRKPDGK